MIPLSKSRYLNGHQCLKYLWIKYNNSELIPSELSSSAQKRFREGKEVDEFAKGYFPSGVDIPEKPRELNLKETKSALGKREILFQPGFLVGGLYVRVDILRPSEDAGWDLIEVKSSTKVKDEHIVDVAFQKFVSEKFGLKINRCILMHLNKEFRKSGEIKPKDILTETDISEEIEKEILGVAERIEEMLDTIDQDGCPSLLVGSHCKKPYECPLMDHCWRDLPSSSVVELSRGMSKAKKLMESNIYLLKDIPGDVKLTAKQKIQVDCAVQKTPQVNSAEITSFVEALQYPLYYFDFEAIQPAIPLYEGTWPYQQVCFQYSIHVVRTEGSEPKHYSFLHSGTDDPRPALLDQLKEEIGESGSVIVYHKQFECDRLKEMAEEFPQHADWISNVLGRIVDLETPFVKFHYYDSGMVGKSSLKKVLPTLLGENPYKKLVIQEGGTASDTFLKAEFGEMGQADRNQARTDMEKYCELDTFGMVLIIEILKEVLS